MIKMSLKQRIGIYDERLQAWEDWYNGGFEDDLDNWFFNSFSFTKQGNLAHKRVLNGKPLVGTGERYFTNGTGELYENGRNDPDYG